MIDRIAPRFARYEPLRRASELMLGMVSGLDRKNCWTIAEHRCDTSPDGLQHLLSRAQWDADGHALIDRALYLPRSWVDDPDRCTDAGIPANKQCWATKPMLAAGPITRAVAARVPAAWVAGDEVYGADPRLRAGIRGHRLGYVLAVSANRRVRTHAGPIRVARLPAQLPSWAWHKHSTGTGSHGQRYYS
jgi:hypothetical protein